MTVRDIPHSSQLHFPQPLAVLDQHLTKPNQVVDLVLGPNVRISYLNPLHITIQALAEDRVVSMTHLTIFDLETVYTLRRPCIRKETYFTT